MLAVLRHRRLRLLHLLLPLLVGLGVFGTSLVAALTDVHMLSHNSIGANVHDHDDAALVVAPDAEDTANSLLHALVHCMDCHGHGSVLPTLHPVWSLSQPLPLLACHDDQAQCAWQPPESLFRPPIAV